MPICRYCPTPIPQGRVTCGSPACHRAYDREAKHRHDLKVRKHRFCRYCGEDITGTPLRNCCRKQECRDRRNEEKLEEKRTQKDAPVKGHRCRYPGCSKSTGVNYFYCKRHAELMNIYSDDCVGFGGDWHVNPLGGMKER